MTPIERAIESLKGMPRQEWRYCQSCDAILVADKDGAFKHPDEGCKIIFDNA